MAKKPIPFLKGTRIRGEEEEKNKKNWSCPIHKASKYLSKM